MGKQPFSFVAKAGKARSLNRTRHSKNAITAGRPKASVPVKKRPAVASPVLYTRNGRAFKGREDRAVWNRSLQEILDCSLGKLIEVLQTDGVLPKMQGAVCPFCKKGILGSLKETVRGKMPVHRCSKKGCQRFVSPLHNHRVFSSGGGREAPTLRVPNLSSHALHALVRRRACVLTVRA